MGNSQTTRRFVLMLVGVVLYVLGMTQSGPLDNPLLAFWVLVLLAGVGLFWLGLAGSNKKRTNDSR